MGRRRNGAGSGASGGSGLSASGSVTYDLDLTGLANHAAFTNGATATWTDSYGNAAVATFLVGDANTAISIVNGSGVKWALTASPGATCGFTIPLASLCNGFAVDWALGDWDIYLNLDFPVNDTYEVQAGISFDSSYNGVYAGNVITAGACVAKTAGLGGATITYTGSGAEKVLCISKRGGTYSVAYAPTYSSDFPAHSAMKLVGSNVLNAANLAVLNGSIPPTTQPFLIVFTDSTTITAERDVYLKRIKVISRAG